MKKQTIVKVVLSLLAMVVASVLFTLISMRFLKALGEGDRLIIGVEMGMWGCLLPSLVCIWSRSKVGIPWRIALWLLSTVICYLLIFFAFPYASIWAVASPFLIWVWFRTGPRTEDPMPWSFWAASAGFAYFIVLNGSYYLRSGFEAHTHNPGPGLAVIILVGLIHKNRLAWQWSRLAMFATALLYPIIAASERTDWSGGLWDLGFVILSTSLPALAVAIALGRPSARVFMGLVCPQCGSTSVKAGDLLFRRMKCKACGNLWPDKNKK